MKTRQARRLEAKLKKETFVPQYNGNDVQTFEEFHGVGYERFNSKYATVAEQEQLDEEGNDNL